MTSQTYQHTYNRKLEQDAEALAALGIRDVRQLRMMRYVYNKEGQTSFSSLIHGYTRLEVINAIADGYLKLKETGPWLTPRGKAVYEKAMEYGMRGSDLRRKVSSEETPGENKNGR